MMKSVVREHKWLPEIIDGLYLDDADHFGLEFWYNDVKQMNDELKERYSKK